MAREESDRDNLLREATALVERIELAPAADAAAEHVVIGFRANSAASFYFGADLVYQFNAAGELRRAYGDGRLFKPSRGRLVSLNRERLPEETRLVSRELSDGEVRSFVIHMSDRLRQLATDLDAGRYGIVGQVPMDADIFSRVRKWLAEHDGRSIARSPRVDA